MIIRFPHYADLRDGKAPMAKKLSLWQRLFGTPPKRVNVAKRRIERARRAV